MNQQVNLYLTEFRSKKDPLTATLITQVLGGILIVMFLVSLYGLFHRIQLSMELSSLNETLEEEKAKTEDLNRELAGRTQDGDLARRLEIAEARLESRRQIRNFLNETQLGNVVGFSEYFKDLSHASLEGLSITNFSFENGGESVTISGRVVQSARISLTICQLRTSVGIRRQGTTRCGSVRPRSHHQATTALCLTSISPASPTVPRLTA